MSILLWFLAVCCLWRVCPLNFLFFIFYFLFFFLFVNDLHFILGLLMSRIIFLLSLSFVSSSSSSLSFYFFSALPVIGGEFTKWIRAAWSTPTYWLFWVSRGVSIILFLFVFIFYFFFFFFCKLFFGDHRWGVGALFHIYHMKSFNYDAKEARDVGLSCRCHLSNSQIVSSV